jgi:hypothetical protein
VVDAPAGGIDLEEHQCGIFDPDLSAGATHEGDVGFVEGSDDGNDEDFRAWRCLG